MLTVNAKVTLPQATHTGKLLSYYCSLVTRYRAESGKYLAACFLSKVGKYIWQEL
jgi:hypothetical protein